MQCWRRGGAWRLGRGNNPYGRAQGGAKAWAPAFDGTRRPAGLSLPDGVAGTAGRLRGLLSQWLLAELAPVRLIPWVPIAFGAGIACYFAADREPHVWAVLSVAIGAVAVALWRAGVHSVFRSPLAPPVYLRDSPLQHCRPPYRTPLSAMVLARFSSVVGWSA